MKKSHYLIWIFVGLIIYTNQVLGAGLLITPNKLSIQVKVRDQASSELYIKNISHRPVIYSLYSDELEDQIVIQPNFLRLETNELQKVKVIVKPKEVGIYLTNISVVAQDLDRREFNASPGVKVPLQIIVLAGPGSSFSEIVRGVIIIGVLLLTLIISVVLIRQRRKRSLWQKAINLLHHQKSWWRKIFD